MTSRQVPMCLARLAASLLAASLLAGLCLASALSASAFAADDEEQRSQAPGARTVIGGGRADAECSRLVGLGDAADRTLETCTRALDEARNSADRVRLHVNRGVILLRRNDAEAGLAEFDEAIAINPDSPEAHVNRGAALVRLHRPGPAVAALTRALSLGVAEPYKAYYNRGAAREALGDLRGAYEDFTTALEIHPEWAPAEAEVARFVRQRQSSLATALADEGQGPPPQ